MIISGIFFLFLSLKTKIFKKIWHVHALTNLSEVISASVWPISSYATIYLNCLTDWHRWPSFAIKGASLSCTLLALVKINNQNIERQRCVERLRSLMAMLQPGCCHFSRYSKKKINAQPLHATEHSGRGMKPHRLYVRQGNRQDLKS